MVLDRGFGWKTSGVGQSGLTSQYKETSSVQCLTDWKMDTFSMGSQGWRESGGLANRNSRRGKLWRVSEDGRAQEVGHRKKPKENFPKETLMSKRPRTVRRIPQTWLCCTIPQAHFPHSLQRLRKRLTQGDSLRCSGHTKETVAWGKRKGTWAKSYILELMDSGTWFTAKPNLEFDIKPTLVSSNLY